VKVPADVAARIRGGAHLGFEMDADDRVVGGFEHWGAGEYPPPGYVAWNRLEVGNGDTYGFYWPMGREDGPPLVCTVEHDAWALRPLATSLAAAVRLHVAARPDDSDAWAELGDDFGVPLHDARRRDRRMDIERDWAYEGAGGHAYWAIQAADELLHLDPDSPALLLARAAEYRHPQVLDEAERSLVRALEILPEYTAAWWALVQVRRRRRAPAPELIDAMVSCITSPLAFGPADRRTCLGWLRRLPDAADAENRDPVWLRRARLAFAEGARDNGDYAVLDECMAEYHARGQSLRAARLRVLYGEMMGAETVSFRERAGFAWPAHWDAMREDLRRAGLDARLPAIPAP
jgi:hypothetical protein